MPYLFALTLLLAPLYVWRFSIGGLSTNFLMMVNFAVIAAGLILMLRSGVVNAWEKNKRIVASLGKPLIVGIALIKIASIISLFAFGIDSAKIAQWLVLYVQPLSIFYLILYFEDDNQTVAEHLKVAAYVLVASAGFLAVIQYFTLLALPQQWWGNANEPKRAIAFFAHANAYGLFVTPLLAWLIPDVAKRFWESSKYKIICGFAWVLGVAGILLTLSRGAWLGLAVAVAGFVIISANRKMLITFAVGAVLAAGIVAAVPNLRYRVILPFHGEKSAVARISLWNTAGKMISDNPILGKGIMGFSNNWDKYNTDQGLEHYNFPHNILLNFWIDLGLFGILGFAIVFLNAIWKGIKNRRQELTLGAALFVIAMLAHGLIDIPYLKNDLALVFWMILGLSAIAKSSGIKQTS